MTAVPRDDKPVHANNPQAVLSGYRGLDLCDEKAYFVPSLWPISEPMWS